MPDFTTIAPASRTTTRRVRIGIVDLAGNLGYVNLSNIGAGVTDAQINALRSSIGAASNGGVFMDEKVVTQSQRPADSRAFAEPFSSVTFKGVLVFDHPNPQVQRVYLEVPSIGANYVSEGGVIDPQQADIQAIINDALPILNDSNPFTGDFFFERAYLSDRKGSGDVNISQQPTTVDPRGTSEPT